MATISKYQTFLFTQMNGGVNTTGNAISDPNRVIDFDSDTIRIMLVTNSYTPDAVSHAVIADVTNEVMGAGYTIGGPTLTSPSVTLISGEVFFKANNIVINEAVGGFNDARYGIVYKDSGTSTTSTLIAYINFLSDKGNATSDLILQFDNAGLIKWS